MMEKPENMDLNTEEADDLIELVDEEGETQVFELLGSFELEGNNYLAVADPEEEEDAEAVACRSRIICCRVIRIAVTTASNSGL